MCQPSRLDFSGAMYSSSDRTPDSQMRFLPNFHYASVTWWLLCFGAATHPSLTAS
ncbi:hypothetical protein BAUCODRAFT_34898 [Baudoinia panamericana UAMH 10762]|uniref:Uncharacterized protein n=1 Tax=Baudoinia panamericana (strain UAMH 10762) TaxID=717646 RepID=M2MHM2_BAUPA|nr:uncharacterized protein BAUCODRAFT_34898 [Baudoinia panamericana UAMH 10762]EMC96116.1 hypothetical protein BAUCODRAFT_34898 [Baudoinia panamericana UAMH 10762]